MHVIINTAALNAEECPISNDAAAKVRMGFNPSTLPRVDRIKALAAALISECEAVQAEGGDGREASVAITNVQQASMWAVAAATSHLSK
ncbi:MAG: hypothetical protein Tsb0020_53630 [Haliangiales bacterium]